MPSGRLKTFTYYGKDGKEYPFAAISESVAVHYAKEWGRKHGIKLYRRKNG